MGLFNRAKYYEVTFCRIEVSTDANAGSSYDPNTYVPAQYGPDGSLITPAQGDHQQQILVVLQKIV
ncbi:MAG: hypothetical protein CM15mV42_0090 [uncultured marine virus]|nr:MAG: hypothetical protein CM15mV42_0090 [uncultured marine virus]